MKKLTFLALAMSLGLMTIEQAGATVANPGIASAATATQTGAVTKVWWRGGPGYGWRPGYGWVPFAAFGAAVAATAATSAYYYGPRYYGPGPYYYGPGPYYGPCGAGPCAPPPAPIK